MANKIPSWCPDALPTSIGWAHPITGEQLVYHNALEDAITYYKPNAGPQSFIASDDVVKTLLRIVKKGTNVAHLAILSLEDVTSVSWDFGDSETLEAGTQVKHAYAADGTYTVTATVNVVIDGTPDTVEVTGTFKAGIPSAIEPPVYIGDPTDNDPEIAYPSPINMSNTINPGYSGDFITMKVDQGASLGAWTGDEIVYTYQWTRYDSELSEPVDIVGATNIDYYFTEADLGYAIGVKVTGTNSAGSDTAVCDWVNYAGDFASNVVVDVSLAPNDVASGTAVAGGNAGEMQITLVPGEQIVDHPDTQYHIRLSSNENPTVVKILTSSSELLTGLLPGTYDVSVSKVFNDVTGIFSFVNIGTDVVVA